MTSEMVECGILEALRRTVGVNLYNEIRSCNIVVVGAGGIGCELLKNLSWCGFWNCHVLDLDTIDVSNLNRQLLFRSNHVGLPKCTVACQVATDLVQSTIDISSTTTNHGTVTTGNDDGDNTTTASTIKFVPYHGNICDSTVFNVSFLQKNKIDLVINALDNVIARRRVNRLCLATNIPLLDAGTTGYLGQCRTIHKSSSIACYECTTQETAKVYPICTIRSTPTTPVHTIVWAKELYKLLFNPKVEDSMLYESTDPTETDEVSTYMSTAIEYRTKIGCTSTDQPEALIDSDETIRTVAIRLLTNLYQDEINKQIGMDRYKTSLIKPTPLDIHDYIQQAILSSNDSGGDDDDEKRFWLLPPPRERSSYKQTDVLSITDCIVEFITCLIEAFKSPSNEILPTFDKDDVLGMRFVTVASNLRNAVFRIQPMQSYYSAKGIAGNIVPAIASTNAIAAGLQILQVFQILKAKLQQSNDEINNKSVPTTELTNLKDYCSYIDIHRHQTRNGLLLSTSKLEEPNPNCFVCKNATVTVQVLAVDNWTLQDVVTKILKAHLGFQEPTVAIDGDIVWEEGDGADVDTYIVNATKKLSALPAGGIHHGTVVSIEDFSQDLTIELAILEKEQQHDDNDVLVDVDTDPYKFVIVGKTQPTQSTAPTPSPVDVAAPIPTLTSVSEQMTTVTTTAMAVKDDEIAKVVVDEKIATKADHDDGLIIVIDTDDEEEFSTSIKKRSADNDHGDEDGERATKRMKTDKGNSSEDVIEIDDD